MIPMSGASHLLMQLLQRIFVPESPTWWHRSRPACLSRSRFADLSRRHATPAPGGKALHLQGPHSAIIRCFLSVYAPS